MGLNRTTNSQTDTNIDSQVYAAEMESIKNIWPFDTNEFIIFCVPKDRRDNICAAVKHAWLRPKGKGEYTLNIRGFRGQDVYPWTAIEKNNKIYLKDESGEISVLDSLSIDSGDSLLLFNPKDERYKRFMAKKETVDKIKKLRLYRGLDFLKVQEGKKKKETLEAVGDKFEFFIDKEEVASQEYRVYSRFTDAFIEELKKQDSSVVLQKETIENNDHHGWGERQFEEWRRMIIESLKKPQEKMSLPFELSYIEFGYNCVLIDYVVSDAVFDGVVEVPDNQSWLKQWIRIALEKLQIEFRFINESNIITFRIFNDVFAGFLDDATVEKPSGKVYDSRPNRQTSVNNNLDKSHRETKVSNENIVSKTITNPQPPQSSQPPQSPQPSQSPQPPRPSQPSIQEEPKKKSKTGIIVGVVLGVIALVAALLFFLMKNKEDNKALKESLMEQQAHYEQQLQQVSQQTSQSKTQSNKLKGYEWLEGVWAGAIDYEFFGRMIITDSYYQVLNSNWDDAFANVEDMTKQDFVLKKRENAYDGYDDDGEVFGFSEYVGVDPSRQIIYIIQGEYNSVVLHKIQDYSIEAAVFKANHNYPRRVYSNAYDGFVNIRQKPQGKAPILGVLRNGPEGAVLLGAEGEWKKVDCNGIVGYVYEKYVQDTPTEVFQGE